MRKMKDSGVKWITLIPDDWTILPLKSISEFGKGLPITKADLTEVGVPVVSYGQIHSKTNSGTHLKPELVRYVPETFLESNPLSLSLPGDLFFADTSEDYNGIGNAVLIDTDTPVFAGYHTIIVRPKRANKYLAYLCLSQAWRSQLRSMAAGIKVFSVTQTMLKKTTVVMPSDEEQNAITKALDIKCAEVDALIVNQEAQIEKLKAYKQSLITEVVTKGLDPDVPMKDSGVEWIGKIPEGWKLSRIKNLFELRNERNSEADLNKVNLISLYTDLGVVQHSDIVETTGNRAVTADGYKKVYKDDIVVNIILCWMGAVGKSDYDGVTSPAYDVYKPKQGVNSNYYHYLFRTKQFNGECFRYGRGIMMMRWRTYSAEFTSIDIPVPSDKEQREIVEYLTEKSMQIDKLISIKQAKIEKLNQYKKSLIYEYVTGKKEVV